MSQQHYEPEFKQQIVRLHIEERRTYRSLMAEYGVSLFIVFNNSNKNLRIF